MKERAEKSTVYMDNGAGSRTRGIDKQEAAEIERLARALASRTGETPTQAIIVALRERPGHTMPSPDEVEARVQRALAIGRHVATLPIFDTRSAEEIIGYDEYGVPR